ncbi:MAG: hypothetical protein QXP77_03235 [Candidatus Aenigmatarchaeota archaeon]
MSKNFEFDIPNIEIPEIEIPFEEEKIPSSKMSKPKLIEILSEKLTSEEIYRALIRLGKHKIAEEFMNEVNLINKRYKELLGRIEGGSEELENKIITNIIEEIISKLKRLYTLSFKPTNEIEFHKQIEPFLKGLASALESSLSKFGLIITITREYKLPSNERIDLIISVGQIKIGIEVKYSLEETSQVQRLLGQIDEYINYVDALIILSYSPLNSKTLQILKRKKMKKVNS